MKRSLDVAEQAQYEKGAAEIEIRRLKDELERQHLKLRDAIADQVIKRIKSFIFVINNIHFRVAELRMNVRLLKEGTLNKLNN